MHVPVMGGIERAAKQANALPRARAIKVVDVGQGVAPICFEIDYTIYRLSSTNSIGSNNSYYRLRDNVFLVGVGSIT